MFSWTVDNMCSTLRRLINDVIIIVIIVISNFFLVLRFSIFFNLDVISDIEEQSTACVPRGFQILAKPVRFHFRAHEWTCSAVKKLPSNR